MELNEQKLELLLSNEFIIDCIQIQLKQQTEINPIIYSGSGSIFQKKDGNFHLKLYHLFSGGSEDFFQNLVNTSPGEIIGKEEYFGMEAIDMSGNVWTAENISISNSFSSPAVGKVINTIIRKLHCKGERNSSTNTTSNFLFFVLPGMFSIPCNHREELPKGGWSLNTCKLDIRGISLEIRERKDSLTIEVKDPSGDISFSFRDRLIEALSIIFGKLCPVLYSTFSIENIRTSTLSSIPSGMPNKKLVSPIPHISPMDIDSFREFIEKYIIRFEKEHDIFFGYWHKINRSWQGGIENAALTISTAVEGITKNFYSEYGLPDDEIVQQAEDAKKKVGELDIGQRIKSRVQSSLGQVKSSSPKNALYKLVSENKIDKKLVDGWVSLRNKAAHADSLDDSVQEVQKYIDEVYICQNLFNVLLLLHIDFNGQYWDLSTKGWPKKILTLDSESKVDV